MPNSTEAAPISIRSVWCGICENQSFFQSCSWCAKAKWRLKAAKEFPEVIQKLIEDGDKSYYMFSFDWNSYLL